MVMMEYPREEKPTKLHCCEFKKQPRFLSKTIHVYTYSKQYQGGMVRNHS